MKKIEEIMASVVKNNYLVIANLELDAFSYPVPGKNGERTVERFFLYSNQPKTIKYRPYAWIVIDSETGRIVQFSRCECIDFAQNLQIPMERQIDYSAPLKVSHKELRNKQLEFNSVYARMREFAFSTTIDESRKDVLFQYKNLQEQLINVEVMPFYQSLSPDFYEWMNTML